MTTQTTAKWSTTHGISMAKLNGIDLSVTGTRGDWAYKAGHVTGHHTTKRGAMLAAEAVAKEERQPEQETKLAWVRTSPGHYQADVCGHRWNIDRYKHEEDSGQTWLIWHTTDETRYTESSNEVGGSDRLDEVKRIATRDAVQRILHGTRGLTDRHEACFNPNTAIDEEATAPTADQPRDMAPRNQPKARSAKMARNTEPKPCACGCKNMTGGGLYLPGHDAKHKTQLFDAADKGDKDAIKTIKDKKWDALYEKHVHAVKVREERAKVTDAEKAEKAAKRKADREAKAAEKAKKKTLAEQTRDAVRKDSAKNSKKNIKTEKPTDGDPVADVDTLEPGTKVMFDLGKERVEGSVISASVRADGVPVVYIEHESKKYARESLTVSLVK